MLKDIFNLEKITSTELYGRLMELMIDNIGNEFSTNSITKLLKSEKRSPKHDVVMNYLLYACNAYLFYQVKRYDIKGKKILKTLEKYYVVDSAFYYLFHDESTRNLGHLLENIVYLELIRRGYNVHIGKNYNLEVDFVCRKPGETFYVQVSNTVLDNITRKREYKSLRT